jgi:HK97 family phage portal protein
MFEKLSRYIVGKAFNNASVMSMFNLNTAHSGAVNSAELIKKVRGWSYTCISKNATAVAQTPLRLYGVKGHVDGSKFKTVPVDHSKQGFLRTKLAERVHGAAILEEITDHPIITLLNHVNPNTNAYDLKDITVKYLESIGVDYWYLERGQGDEIINIWPLFSQNVEPVFNKEKSKLAGYKYGQGVNAKTYKPEDIVHFKYTSMTSMYRGDSPLMAVEQSVDLNEAMNLFEIAMFKNGGTPSMFLEVPTDGVIGDNDRKRLQADFRKNVGGVKNAGKLVIGAGGAKYTKTGCTPKEMSYTQGRATTLEETFGAFGVPLVFAKSTEVSRDNFRASVEWWMKWTINPKLTMIEQKLNEQFTPNWGEGLFLLFDDARPTDPDFRLKEIESHLASKYSSINEERAVDGKDPVVWGDEPVEPKPIEVEEAETEKGIEDVEVIEKREGQTNNLPEPDFMPRVFTMQLTKTFMRMEADITKNLRNYGKSKAIEDEASDAAFAGSAGDITSSVYNQTFWGKQISQDAMPFIRGLLDVALVDAMEKVKPDAIINVSSPKVIAALEARSSKIQTVADTVEKEIRGDISESIGLGESRSQTIKRVRDKFDARFKADRVVRTETIWAHNEGTVQAWEQSGVVTAKKWDTVADDRRCPYCKHMDGKVMDISGKYFDQGESLTVKSDAGNDITLKFGYEAIKHPPLHSNCRCQLIPIIAE